VATTVISLPQVVQETLAVIAQSKDLLVVRRVVAQIMVDQAEVAQLKREIQTAKDTEETELVQALQEHQHFTQVVVVVARWLEIL
jgi:hypothetical protein